MDLQDVKVTINLVKPATYIGYGKPLILAKKTGESTIKNYREPEDVVVDFAITTEAYKDAAAIFAQEHRPREIAIATYDPDHLTAALKVEAAAEKYFDEDWFFLLTPDAILADQLLVADFIETKEYKKYVAQTDDPESRNAFKTKDYAHTIEFYTPNDEHAAAALVGELGNQPVGSITWKFKTLKGITPVDVTESELRQIHEDGAITYVRKSGIPQTSEGIVVNGEYIDVMHGRDWVKFTMEQKIQEAFYNQKKIPYTNKGVSLLESQITTVLQTAANMGIVEKDEGDNPLFTVTTAPVEDLTLEQKASRIYNGLGFSYRPEGAIHAANITGEILQN